MRANQLSTARLIALRGRRTREVIAHALRGRGHGTDAKAIWRYETGRSQPNVRLLADYADVLGAGSVDELFVEDEEEAARTVAAAAALEAPSEEMLDALAFAIDAAREKIASQS